MKIFHNVRENNWKRINVKETYFSIQIKEESSNNL
jgi:hypothetical protein